MGNTKRGVGRDVTKLMTFKNPPITEALLDIQTKLPNDVSLETLTRFQDAVKSVFPVKEDRFSWKAGIELKEGVPKYLTPSGGTDGYLFRSSDKNKIVQARLDGFTFNKLKPYESWELFSAEAKELWNNYVEVAKPSNVTRLALRYINRIEIPWPFNDFKEYILTFPDIAPGLPQGLSEFLVRLVIPDEKLKAFAIVTENLSSSPRDAQTVPVIFDIDVFKLVNSKPGESEIWENFEALRVFKNEIFLKSMTDKAKELFK